MLERVAHAGPRAQRTGCQEPAFTDWLLGVRHAAPDPDAAVGGAAQVTQIGMYDGGMSGNDCHDQIVVCKAE